MPFMKILYCKKMSADCNDNADADEVEKMLAGDAGIFIQVLSLSRRKFYNAIFMKSRYPILTSGFDF
jgi:hypothetical protein